MEGSAILALLTSGSNPMSSSGRPRKSTRDNSSGEGQQRNIQEDTQALDLTEEGSRAEETPNSADTDEDDIGTPPSKKRKDSKPNIPSPKVTIEVSESSPINKYLSENGDDKDIGDNGPDKAHTCEICFLSFDTPSHLRKHRTSHNGVRPYECRNCTKRFSRRSDQQLHILESHSSSGQTHQRCLPFHCPVCNKGFQRQIAMRAHFQNEHIGTRASDGAWTCGICGMSDSSSNLILSHMIRDHHINPEGLGPSPGPLLGNQLRTHLTQQPPSSESALLQSLKTEPKAPGPHHVSDALEKVILGAAHGEGSRIHPDDTSSTGSPSPRGRPPSVSPPPVVRSGEFPAYFLTPKVEMGDCSPWTTITPKSEEMSSKRTSPFAENNNSPSPQHRVKPENKDSFTSEEQHRTDTRDRLCTSSPSSSESQSAQPRRSSSSMMTHLKSLLNDPPSLASIPSRTDGLPFSFCPTAPRTASNTPNPHQSLAFSILQKFNPFFPCLFCGITFPDQTLYFLHKGCHSEGDPWKCNICGEVTANMYDFNAHLLSKAHR